MALARAARVAEGPVAIHELYLEGIYEQVVQPWFALADAAARALRRGESAPHVPTRRIGQASMRPWARGVVWDCGNPLACVPVARSSRDTPFRGERQLDRAALRAAAHALALHDTDIVAQAQVKAASKHAPTASSRPFSPSTTRGSWRRLMQRTR